MSFLQGECVAKRRQCAVRISHGPAFLCHHTAIIDVLERPRKGRRVDLTRAYILGTRDRLIHMAAAKSINTKLALLNATLCEKLNAVLAA